MTVRGLVFIIQNSGEANESWVQVRAAQLLEMRRRDEEKGGGGCGGGGKGRSDLVVWGGRTGSNKGHHTFLFTTS